MGWWSTDIMGGDSPLDWEGDFYDVCGVDMWIGNKQKPLTKEILEKNISAMVSKVENEKYAEDRNIGFQVIGVLLMKSGSVIDPTLKKKITQACKDDEWAKEDDERKASVNSFMEKLKEYKGETPVVIKSKGLFEVMAEKISK